MWGHLVSVRYNNHVPPRGHQQWYRMVVLIRTSLAVMLHV